MTAAPIPARLKTKAELAERWDVSERTVQRLVDSGSLGAIRIGRQLRFSPEDVAQYERTHRA